MRTHFGALVTASLAVLASPVSAQLPAFSARSHFVVYGADELTGTVYEADLKTGHVVKLNGPLVSGGDVAVAD
jgi:hypothetical protein